MSKGCPHSQMLLKSECLKCQIATLTNQHRIMREALEAIDESGILNGSYNIHDKLHGLVAEALHAINNNNQKGDN